MIYDIYTYTDIHICMTQAKDPKQFWTPFLPVSRKILVDSLDRTRLDWTELDWTGINWTGLDWTGLDLEPSEAI